jgi:hypothetical protein
VSFTANAVELINPYKGGSLAIELYSIMSKHLTAKNISHTTVTVDACRAVPSNWKQYKSPLYISWSDASECNLESKHINVLSKATQLFCSARDVDLSKKSFKAGWQASAPLNGIYETFENKFGKITKVPYLNGGQQVQGAISGEIDFALIGQGTAMSSSLKCFMAVTPFENLPVLEHSYGDMYTSLIGILYEDAALQSIVKEYIELPEIKSWKEKRKLQSVNSNDDKKLFLDNSFNRK